MSYSDKIIEKLTDKTFLNRCQCEFYLAAIAVSSEPDTTENYANRQKLAKTIVYNRLPPEIMAHAILTNATMQTKIESDNLTYYDDFQFVIGSVFNAVADAHVFFNGV